MRNAAAALRSSTQAAQPQTTTAAPTSEAKPSLMERALAKAAAEPVTVDQVKTEPTQATAVQAESAQPESTQARPIETATAPIESVQTESPHRAPPQSEASTAASSPEPFNAAPENTSPPAAMETEALEATGESHSFDGNWRNLIERHLKLGIARALAQNCEMMAYDANSITLRVAEKQKHLVSATYQEKLSHAINSHFGRKIQLTFNIDNEANTPAKQQAEEKAVIQSSAEEAIMGDDFVQSLLNDFDAKIIPNSIKPIT